MRILVVGGGVAGVTTAYWLSRAGMEVVILEREPSLASVTSYATGGHIAPGHSGAWASPQSLRTLARSLVRRGLSYKLHLRADPTFVRWAVAYARNCTEPQYRRNTATKIRLAAYSRDRLHEIVETTGVQYDRAARGAVFFYRSAARVQRAAARVPLWREAGIDLQVLDAAGIRALDIRLDPVASVAAGALYSPIDEVGDTRLFVERLAEWLAGRGVTIRVGMPVTGLERAGSAVVGVQTTEGLLRADAVVLATGDGAPELSKAVGLRLPVFPVRGYTVTLPARGDVVPDIGIVDEEGLLAIARLGDRVRLGGTAEFGRTDRRIERAGIDRQISIARGLFPDGAAWDQPDAYACLRPMTPDGPPIVGRSSLENLYLNVGHGHIGWTMSAGAGRIVADLVAGRPPAVNLRGITADRYTRSRSAAHRSTERPFDSM